MVQGFRQPVDGRADRRGALGSILARGAAAYGTVQAFRLRQTTPDPRRAAIAWGEHVRTQRTEARAIVDRNPVAARELRIGRPDVCGRTYDDGGLVDLNHAEPQALVDVLELTPTQASELVRVRRELSGFGDLRELSAFTSLPGRVVERLQERAVFIR